MILIKKLRCVGNTMKRMQEALEYSRKPPDISLKEKIDSPSPKPRVDPLAKRVIIRCPSDPHISTQTCTSFEGLAKKRIHRFSVDTLYHPTTFERLFLSKRATLDPESN
jgi:hypothetical protein